MKTFTSTIFALALLGASAFGAAVPAAKADVSQPAKRDFYGDATYYYQYGVAGSCGEYHADGDVIAALPPSQIGGSCGRTIRVSRAGYNDIYARVADTCPGCAYGSIDLSTGAFDQIGNEAEGRIQVNWDFV
ncbi:unnamed protein product [Tilletia controversa]|uniref:RlpA-like protein double-psi beta-barrel domain-containing protein n=3 Tax=Tilletia TaxID=13289 RepID=A0A8X7SXC8_9BASI|nr:hypothetical protein CF336_g1471 [Tilletia laevis]KAE8204024.1 hypothetical protein CF328_g1327 [Tilletia controversa]KAE8264099.1 hypothetical protein A4X03_0g1188 [Tilletia caries]KAE8202572.1 hypothetical protein CF335_g3364 [Tilletia laevis]KAE8247911.1 hypothetical protein A4X06_0g4101 [Tilletia controversa]